MDWALTALIVGSSIPGILVVVPQTLDRLQATATERFGSARDVPSSSRLALVSVVQTVVLVGIAATVGAFAAPIVGFRAPVFEAIVDRGGIWATLRPQLGPVIGASIVGSGSLLFAYYRLFRPRLDRQTVSAMEDLRMDIGLVGRVLYGGVVEEILTRWGLLSLVAWIGVRIVGEPTPAVIWTAIVVAGVLFGIGHLPSYLAAGCLFTPTFLAFTVSLNLGASLVFGWLFWHYGLAAAMLSHGLFHAFWWPLDRIYAGAPGIENREH